jgi:hypothetical protein
VTKPKGRVGGDDLASSTLPPPFDPEEYARESESTMVAPPAAAYTQRPTAPPDAAYDELRESCSTQMVAAKPLELPYEGGAGDWQSEVRVVSTPPAADLGDDELPPLESVPVLAVAQEDLAWFDLDAETNALVKKVNGRDSIAKIAAASKVQPADAQQIFQELAKVGAIELRA